MTKNQLIEALIEKHEAKRESYITKADMAAVVEGLTEIVHEQLVECGEIALPGIGKLVVTERAARTGRNPQTGESVQIPASRSARLKPSKTLKEALNND